MLQRNLMFILGFAMLWFFALLYFIPLLFQISDDSRKSMKEIEKIRDKLTSFKVNNERLSELIERSNIVVDNDPLSKGKQKAEINNGVAYLESARNLRKAEEKIQNLESQLAKLREKLHQQHNVAKNQNADETVSVYSSNFERLQRRVANEIKEMWFLVSASYSKLEKKIPTESRKGFEELIDNFGELQRITEIDYENLMAMDGAQTRRDNIASNLSKLIQKRIYSLQHPKDCENAKKLVCMLNKGCGYGCQAHHVLYCFMAAYATKRTLVLEDKGWRYSSKGWASYFSKVSDSCTHFNHPKEWNNNHEQFKVVLFPIVDGLFPRPKQMPQNVPKEFYDRIQSFHGHPFVWWIGQFAKYLFRYSPEVRKKIEKRKKEMNFKGPIVGVQVRRTDKINLEAAFHDIGEYMYWVDLYYQKLQLTQKVDKKRVFLASDDSTVLADAQKKYPDYEFLTDTKVSKSAGLSERYTDLSLLGVISDIELLSETDYIVCTFSSQVCRVAYEIMNNKHTDASQRFRSLDDIYYFGGQEEHRMKALWPHQGKKGNEISFEKGDIIGIAGNHWNGQSKGLHHKSQRSGLFPSYKVEDVHDIAEFPAYDDDKK